MFSLVGSAHAVEHGVVLQPLSAPQRAILLGSGEDPAAQELGGTTDRLKGKHYVTSNENALQRFEPSLRGLGGAYVGVGSDQSYLMIGWQRAQLAWLFDYDPVVADIHDVHLAFFAAAADAADLLRLWSVEERARSLAVLDAAYEGAQREAARAAYRAYRLMVAKRMQRTAAQHRELSVASYFTAPDQFAHVSGLVRAGRVRRMVGDLTGKHGLSGIARAARELGVPIRVLYMSNAEEYFRQAGYSAQFRENMRVLLTDEQALVLRTIATYPDNRDFIYATQSGHNFVEWLDRPWLKNVFQIVKTVRRSREQVTQDRYPLVSLDADPDASAAGRYAARHPIVRRHTRATPRRSRHVALDTSMPAPSPGAALTGSR